VRRSALLSAMRNVIATLAPSRPAVAAFDEVLR
jgi:FXSXX-COOH protein